MFSTGSFQNPDLHFYGFSCWKSLKRSNNNWIQLNRVIIHFSAAFFFSKKCFNVFLCFSRVKHTRHSAENILPCVGCNVVICCEESQRVFFCAQKPCWVRLISHNHQPIVSVHHSISFLYDTTQKIKHESLVKSIEILKSFQISVLKRQKSRFWFFFFGEEPRGHRNFIAHREISWVEQCIKCFLSIARALLTKQHVKKEYQDIFNPPRRFSDFVSWSLSLNL